LLDLLSLGSAKAYIKQGGKLNSHLTASCVRNIRTKKYQNSKFVNWFSTYSQKCRRCFFWDTVYILFLQVYISGKKT